MPATASARCRPLRSTVRTQCMNDGPTIHKHAVSFTFRVGVVDVVDFLLNHRVRIGEQNCATIVDRTTSPLVLFRLAQRATVHEDIVNEHFDFMTATRWSF